MADFAGMTVKITLKQPPGMILHGVVREVVAGQTLILHNVFCPSTGQGWDHWSVQGTAIADLQVLSSQSSSIAPTTRDLGYPPPMPAPASTETSVPPNTRQPHSRDPASFVDPAILSVGRSSTTQPSAQQYFAEAPATPIRVTTSTEAAVPTRETSVQYSSAKVAEPIDREQYPRLSKGVEEDAPDVGGSKKRSRRGQKKKGQQLEQDPPRVMNAEVSRNGNDMNGVVRRGKGWRQGPFLQPSTSVQLDAQTTKKPGRKARTEARESAQNGWATEDATDIQGMDDFDFVASNKLFDKRQVFQELKQGDTTADEDRLVSHNKLARPGTHGGKNLHPTENVLSPKLGPKYNSNEAGSASDADTELNLANGRSSSRHSHSQMSMATRQSSRQNSVLQDGHVPVAPKPKSSDRGLNRSVTSLANRGRKSLPDTERLSSPVSATSAVRYSSRPSQISTEAHFLLVQTSRLCPTLHPSALETLENETVSRFGLTHDAITENAARSIAEQAISMCDFAQNGRQVNNGQEPHGHTLPEQGNLPVIVILAGGHTIGARAVATARHLLGRRIRVILAELPSDSSSGQYVQMRTQLSILKRMQRAGADVKRGSWAKCSQYVKTLSGPPAVIIDALLGGATYTSLAQINSPNIEGTCKEAREMIDWANWSRAPVLSVGCPSGVSAIDASTTIVEGEPLAVRPDKVLCLGVPVSGLHQAMKRGEKWDVSVADVSINMTLRAEEAVAFGQRFVADLKWVP